MKPSRALADRQSVRGTFPGADNWIDVRGCGVSGSDERLVASTQAGAGDITVNDLSDFQVGHGVMVSGNDTYTDGLIWRAATQAAWQTDMPIRPLESLYHTVPDAERYGRIGQHYRRSQNFSEPLDGAVELRGYDGTLGPVVVYFIEIDGCDPLTFRWSDDTARTWKGAHVILTGDWQPLSGGTAIRFRSRQWDRGDAILFDARDQLVTRIAKIKGNVITLAHPATRTVSAAVVRHEDSSALQAAVDMAISAQKHVYLPSGRYRLLKGIAVISPAGLRIEGADPETTLLDMAEGVGAGFWLFHGNDVTIRNLGMVGHTGMADGMPHRFRTTAGRAIWRTHCLRPARAVEIRGTRRVLVENVSVRRIACECFYSQGPGGCGVLREQKPVRTDELTFRRCSVTDCGFNAFNNNDTEEGTSVLDCRMVDVGANAWEGPARFIKFIGNYVRNCGCCSIGNISRRLEELVSLGCGQSVFADNVFEGSSPSRMAIWVSTASTQVVIRNNRFVNYGTTAILVGSVRASGHPFPVGHVVVTGNIIDLTCRSGIPVQRAGIEVGASDTVVSDNQIYVRGECDPTVRGILVLEPAVNIDIHDNLIQNCREGITTGTDTGHVGQVLDEATFEAQGPQIPLDWPTSHAYRGWPLLWTGRDRPEGISIIDHLDPATCRFILQAPGGMQAGDSFEVMPPASNWNIHDNTIEGCARPVTLGPHGSSTSLFQNNIIRRGRASGVRRAIAVAGRHTLRGNHISGFDEPDSTGLYLAPDPKSRQACRCVIAGNIFDQCRHAMQEECAGLWQAARTEANLCIDCGANLPATMPGPQDNALLAPFSLPAIPRPVWRAPRLKAPAPVDGNVAKWPWDDATRVIAFRHDPDGFPAGVWHVRACAGWHADGLLVAVRCEGPRRTALLNDAEIEDAGKGDGLGIVWRAPVGASRGPVLQFWGAFDGTFQIIPRCGMTGAEALKLAQGIVYATQVTDAGWTAEVLLPLALIALAPPERARLNLNVGIRGSDPDGWLLWAPTGERIVYGYLPAYPDQGGELRLET